VFRGACVTTGRALRAAVSCAMADSTQGTADVRRRVKVPVLLEIRNGEQPGSGVKGNEWREWGRADICISLRPWERSDHFCDIIYFSVILLGTVGSAECRPGRSYVEECVLFSSDYLSFAVSHRWNIRVPRGVEDSCESVSHYGGRCYCGNVI
jgi:hypothetical protein